MNESVVTYEINQDGVALVKLNRPAQLNALNSQMRVELSEIVRHIATDATVKALVITGEGRAFCAGGDIKEMSASGTPFDGRDRMREQLHKTILAIYNMEKPVIMAVNGVAVGAGCNFALCGDIILASDQAKFSEIFVKVGLVPDAAGFYFLPRLIGLPKAKELVFRGNIIDACEAERIGLINRVVEHSKLLDEAMGLASELATGPTKAIGLAKTMLNQSLELDLAKSLDYEAMAQSIVKESEDHLEGVQAFKEKRKPHFQGK